MDKRKTFPVLSSHASVDWQFVHDHGKQAQANHYQTVERLAERGGLSWCELHAVVHNRAWREMVENEAMLAVRALEARYLAAVSVEASDTKGLVDALTEARAALHQHYVDWDGEPEDAVPLQLARAKCDEALAQHRGK